MRGDHSNPFKHGSSYKYSSIGSGLSVLATFVYRFQEHVRIVEVRIDH